MLSVSCVQMSSARNCYDENLVRIARYIEGIMAKRPETNLIVFPELATTGLADKEILKDMAERAPSGKSIAMVQELCKKYNTNVIYGLPEKDIFVNTTLYNGAVLVDSTGHILESYQKTHLFSRDKTWSHAGSSFPIMQTSFGKVGIMIGWDAAFPEVARTYAVKEVDLLVTIANWASPYSDDWDLVVRARAFDNTLYHVACNRVGEDEDNHFFGNSKIIDPLGQVICALDEDKEGVIYAKIDLSITEKLREKYYTFLSDRRRDLYR